MGNNFLLERAKQHSKAWKSEFDAAGRDMLSAPSGHLGVKVVAKIRTGNAISAGEHVLLVRRNDDVVVCRDNFEVADVRRPPAGLIALLEASCGMTLAEVEEIHGRSNSVSVRVLSSAAS